MRTPPSKRPPYWKTPAIVGIISEADLMTEIRGLVRSSEPTSATAAALRVYGSEIFGFLVGALDDSHRAREVYGATSDLVTQGLPSFTWSCTLRTWMYAMARVAIRQRASSRDLTARAESSESGKRDSPPFPRLRPYRVAAVRRAASFLRRTLSIEDREILVLRVDRRLSWRELALTSIGTTASELDVSAEESRLQERFRRIRTSLARSAARYGFTIR